MDKFCRLTVSPIYADHEFLILDHVPSQGRNDVTHYTQLKEGGHT